MFTYPKKNSFSNISWVLNPFWILFFRLSHFWLTNLEEAQSLPLVVNRNLKVFEDKLQILPFNRKWDLTNFSSVSSRKSMFDGRCLFITTPVMFEDSRICLGIKLKLFSKCYVYQVIKVFPLKSPHNNRQCRWSVEWEFFCSFCTLFVLMRCLAEKSKAHFTNDKIATGKIIETVLV